MQESPKHFGLSTMQLIHTAPTPPLSLPSSPLHRIRIYRTFGRHCFGAALQPFHGPTLQRPFLVVKAQHGNEAGKSPKQGSGLDQSVPLAADRLSTDTANQSTTIPATFFPPPQSYGGSPLLWIGVGVAISLVFSWAARRIQAYALQQALKSVMQQSKQGNNQFGGIPTAPPGPFPFPPGATKLAPPATFPFPPGATKLASPPASSPVADVAPSIDLSYESQERLHDTAPSQEPQERVENKVKKPAFMDVNIDLVEESQSGSKVGSKESATQQINVESMQVVDPQVSDSAGSSDRSTKGPSGTSANGKPQSFMSVEMLEKMLDDPQVQKMVFPYLPEELRDPVTFKQMIQLPPVRQQLQDALSNMGGEFGPDMMKYMNNDVVKQQFEQIGLTPEEVMGKILANPDIAASLQNSRVVEAIMDCSQNPLNITKYQNDKEVMDALFKIAELFPGATNSPF